MSATSRKYIESKPQKDNTAPGGQSLYYKNVGLFSDPYLDSLSSGKHSPFILQNWDTEGLPEFSATYEWMLQTWSEMKEILPTRSEAQLEERWIQPILKLLGWEYEVQDRMKKWGKTEIPDYSLFESKKSYLKAQGCKTDEAYFEHVLAVADAKQMGVSLDGSKLDKTNPSYQIIWYQQVTGKTWGILTDGRYWRLYSTRAQSKYSTHYEVNIEKFLGDRDDEKFKYFFNIFRKAAFVKEQNSGQSFLDVLFESGERYAREVETRLKARAFHLVELICQGFASGMKDPSEADLKRIYDHSLYYLFRLMFILNCEAKGLLSVHKQSDYFPHSLRYLCGKIKSEHDANQAWSKQFSSYHHISDLFDLLVSGDEKIGIHGFGKEAFASGDANFYKDNPIPNSYLNRVLLELAFAEDKKEKTLLFIDYKKLAADHLGSLFEGLLEFSLVRDGKAKEPVLKNSNGERKVTGSYYTPQYIVDFIVSETLAPLVKDKSIDEILELKVVDPAMGSGHFLLGTVRFLEEAILSRLSEQKDKPFEPQLVNWKVLHSCIYGVDINPLATELAKFSLWMHTAKNGYELEPLSDQLVCADSLLDQFVWNKSFAPIKKRGGFDAIVGNPPYVRIQNLNRVLVEKIRSAYETANAGNADLYIPFIERGVEILGAKGRLGYIVPNKFFTAEYGKKIREYLKEKEIVDRLLDFGDYQVFEGATTYSCILILDKSSPTRKIQCSDIQVTRSDISVGIPSALNEHSEAWVFSNKSEANVIRKISNLPHRFGDLVDKVFQGIATSADSIFILEVLDGDGSKLTVKSKALDDTFSIERGITMPVLKGADLKRYVRGQAKYAVIFPYKIESGKAVGVQEKVLKREFPLTYKYLSKFRTKLEKRTKCDSSNWWLYPYPKNLTLYSEPKILSQVLSDRGAFSADFDGEYCFVGGGTAGGNGISFKVKDQDSILLFLGILNSPIATAFVRAISTRFRGGYSVYGKSTIDKLPIPDLKKIGPSALKAISTLVRNRITAGDTAKANEIEDKINDAIYDLYGLNDKDRREVAQLAASVSGNESNPKKAA